MPGWPSRFFNSPYSSQARQAPFDDSDDDYESYSKRQPFVAPDKIDPYGNYISHGTSDSPRTRPHMHTSSDKMFTSARRKKPGPVEFESRSYPSAGDTIVFDGPLAGAKIGKGRPEDASMDVGNCATCDTRVKWPKGVNEFRCGTCLMVNDLKPAQIRSRSPRDTSSQQQNKPPGKPSGNRGMSRLSPG